MTETKNRILFLKLIELTQDKKIVWKPSSPINDPPPYNGHWVGKTFQTAYHGKYLSLSKFRSGFNSSPNFKDSALLAITGVDGVPIYSFPSHNAVDNLYELVALNVAGVEDIYDTILGKGFQEPNPLKSSW